MLITATRIHNGKQWMPDGTVIEVAENGTITGIYDTVTDGHVQHYDGIICPGFVNVHCHLELSHMKGAIPEHTGLVPFLKQVAITRNSYTQEQKASARHGAFSHMVANGIIGVGDIANTNDTLDLRQQDKIHFHSFIEAIGFSESPRPMFDAATSVYETLGRQAHTNKILRQSIVPHAPYSVSKQLFALIDKYDKKSLLSIHNQESRAEDEYYISKTGAVGELLHAVGIDDGFFVASGNSSLQTYSQWISPTHPLILVHNTYTSRSDIQAAHSVFNNLYWCLCPNANLYIENTLPDIKTMIEECNNICIGTDSLASNHQLSVLAELRTIKQHYPVMNWEDLLRWGTYNGACALQMDGIVGSIEPGKSPALLLIDPANHSDVAILA